MPTSNELQGRVKRATKLLAQDLPAGDRKKVAQLRLLDQLGLTIRQRRPDFDNRGAKEPGPPIKEPPQT